MALPSSHPHDIALSLVLSKVFPPREQGLAAATAAEAWNTKHAVYIAGMLRLIGREVLQTKSRSTYAELVEQVRNVVKLAPDPEDKRVRAALQQLLDMPKTFADVQDAYARMEAIADLYIERETDGPQSTVRIAFQSPLGVFARKHYLAYKALSFHECHVVGQRVLAWCAGVEDNDTETEETGCGKPFPSDGEDDTIDVRVEAFENYLSACHRGDFSFALHSINKFYNYRFPPSSKKMHQQALLNMASFHYNTGGLEVAKACVDEAIKVARMQGDKECLQHCMSLLKRLTSEMQPSTTSIMTPGQPPHISDTGPDTKAETPLDEIWQISQRLDLGESATSAYNRLYRAIGRHEEIVKANRNEAAEISPKEGFEMTIKAPEASMLDDGILHSSHAALWQVLGSSRLAQVYETVAVQSSSRRERDVRLTVAMAKAAMLSRRSMFGEAVSTLVDPGVTEEMSLGEYHKWSQALWDVVEEEARQRSDERALDYIQLHRLPDQGYRQTGPGGPVRVLAHADERLSSDFFNRDAKAGPRRTTDWIDGQFKAVEELKRTLEPSMPKLLGVLHVAATLQLWPAFWKATVIFAEVISDWDADLSLGTSRSVKEGRAMTMLHLAAAQVLDVWDQILRIEDDGLTFSGAYLLARSFGARQSDDEVAADTLLERALTYGDLAVGTARRMGSKERVANSSMLIALLLDERAARLSPNDTARQQILRKRDEMAQLWQEVSQKRPAVGRSQSHNGSVVPNSCGTIERETLYLVDELIVRIGVKIASA